MARILLLLLVVFSGTAAMSAQTVLLRSVIGSGGTLGAQSEGDASTRLSATIGEVLITSTGRTDGSTNHQGFWVPLDLGLVSVDDGSSDATAGDVSNYPNPFSTSTTIRFTVPMDGRVTVRVFNLIGDLVRTIVADVSAAGSQEILVAAQDDLGSPLANGIYLYEVEGTTANGQPFRRMQRLNILR
jgi:hypothetical protein